MNVVVGGFLPGEAPGAIPNGRRIVKVASAPDDANPNGTGGKVVASHAFPADAAAKLARERNEAPERFVYFVEWDTLPGVPVFVRGSKITEPT